MTFLLSMLFLLGFCGGSTPGPTDPSPTLVTHLRALGLRSALLVSSQAIDEQPVWAPDGRRLAINMDQKWSSFDVGSIQLRRGSWHGGEAIAVADPPPTLTSIPDADIRSWQDSARFDPRRITTKSGVVVELASEELGTVFRVTPSDSKPVVVWRTSLENCHSLALSPDEKLVAFLCELNGLVVADIEP